MAIASDARGAFDIFSAGGDATTASVATNVDAFRAELGDPNNGNTPGPLTGGRREINWDGGGATTAATAGPTFTGFTNNRGATFETPGTGFLQTPLNDVALTGIQPTYETTFNTFSPLRIFTPLGSNITDVTFSVPGTSGAVPATVSGFGAIFSDVDLAATTQLEFFDFGGDSILTITAAAGTVPSGSLSFLGAVADAGERVARVRITAGNSALGPADSNGSPVDVVGMDDFFFSEPVVIPEPSALLLAAIGLAACIGCVAARRRL
jgi:hypothetical protein